MFIMMKMTLQPCKMYYQLCESPINFFRLHKQNRELLNSGMILVDILRKNTEIYSGAA
jgi:hypothetical protein